MSLSLLPLYQSMVRQFHTVESDTRFKSDFIAAANLVLDELSNSADLETPIDHIAATDADVDELEEKHYYIVNDGLIVKLIDSGLKHIRGDDSYDKALGNWEARKGDFMVQESHDLQSDQDDDGIPEEDVIGLGYLG